MKTAFLQGFFAWGRLWTPFYRASEHKRLPEALISGALGGLDYARGA